MGDLPGLGGADAVGVGDEGFPEAAFAVDGGVGQLGGLGEGRETGLGRGRGVLAGGEDDPLGEWAGGDTDQAVEDAVAGVGEDQVGVAALGFDDQVGDAVLRVVEVDDQDTLRGVGLAGGGQESAASVFAMTELNSI